MCIEHPGEKCSILLHLPLIVVYYESPLIYHRVRSATEIASVIWSLYNVSSLITSIFHTVGCLYMRTLCLVMAQFVMTICLYLR
jgi:hypothetical protein